MATIALCHSIGCGVGGIMTEEILGLQPNARGIRIAPHCAGTLAWCKGHVTTRQGRIEVGWQRNEKEYRLEVVLPKDVAAEVELPDEAKAVWQSGPSSAPWTGRYAVSGRTTINVRPGSVAKDPANMGAYGHPGDKGMALIAETMFQAILAHSAATRTAFQSIRIGTRSRKRSGQAPLP